MVKTTQPFPPCKIPLRYTTMNHQPFNPINPIYPLNLLTYQPLNLSTSQPLDLSTS